MTESLLAELAAGGITLAASGIDLAVDGPQELLTEDLLARLRDHKTKLLAWLAASGWGAPSPAAAIDLPAAPCPVCASALWWKLPSGEMRCCVCLQSSGELKPERATRVLLVDQPVAHWENYDDELARHRCFQARLRCQHQHNLADVESYGGFVDALAPDGWPAGAIDPAELHACQKCQSLELWQNLLGAWRCMHCDPPHDAIRLLERAERIRRRHGIPAPPGAADLLREMQALGRQRGD